MKLDVYETNISGHHKIIFLIRKAVPKGKPKTASTVAIKIIIKTALMKHFKARFHNLTWDLKYLLGYFSQQ